MMRNSHSSNHHKIHNDCLNEPGCQEETLQVYNDLMKNDNVEATQR
jgi:hypothetical protein